MKYLTKFSKSSLLQIYLEQYKLALVALDQTQEFD